MKILILSNKALGFYKFRWELVRELVKNHKLVLVFPDEEIKDKFLEIGCDYIPIDIDRRGTNLIKDLKLLLNYKRIISRETPDVVLTYTIKPNVYGGLVCRNKGIKYIPNVTGLGSSIENGGIIGRIAKGLYKIGIKHASCVFFQNSSNANLFKSNKIYSGRSRVIPGSGVNLDDFFYINYPCEDSMIRFLFVGRIMKEKGIEETISAIENIHRETPNIVLDIVGDMDDDYKDYLREKQKNGFIQYHGEKTDVHPFYEKAHCVILASYHEGTANVMLEASASGRPVITTTVPGCKETFEEGVTGFGCEAMNVDSLVAAIKKFMELSDWQREEMGRRGREKMIKEFDRNIVVNAYISEINSL